MISQIKNRCETQAVVEKIFRYLCHTSDGLTSLDKPKPSIQLLSGVSVLKVALLPPTGSFSL